MLQPQLHYYLNIQHLNFFLPPFFSSIFEGIKKKKKKYMQGFKALQIY